MPHTDKNQPEFNREPASKHRQKSQLLSRDLESLQAGIRTDFDQKLGELANLLARFKAMVVAPGGNAANDDAKPENIVAPAAFKPEIPHLAEDDTSATVLKIASVNADAGSANDDADQEQARINPSSLRAPESARFESGLYKLNCQLYRFRLELDQEMEFREELLHIHFHQESELSKTLQKISDKSSEKNPDNL